MTENKKGCGRKRYMAKFFYQECGNEFIHKDGESKTHGYTAKIWFCPECSKEVRNIGGQSK